MPPRCVIQGKTYLVTRRCSDRRFFLRPCRETNQICRYALGKAAEKFGVRIHAFEVLSNHLHVIVTDVHGELPNFMHALDLEIAKAVSTQIGRWGGFWDKRTYSAVELLDPDAIIEKMAYTEANAVSSGLVRHARLWPGASSVTMRFGEPVTVRRPQTAYYENSAQPEAVVLELVPPPGMDPTETRQRVDAAIRKIEKAKQIEMRKKNRKFLGAERVQRQDPYDNPTSWEKRRGRNPTFASRDKWARIEASQRKRDWLEVYRDARDRFAAGERNVEFPHGTWAMVQLYGCRCAAAG